MSFYQAINDAIGSRTMGACLKLCGYNAISDFRNFNEQSIKDVEKYVSKVCCVLPREKRFQLIDPIFVDHPELFAFPPVMRVRLLSFVELGFAMGQLCEMNGSFSTFNALETDYDDISLLINETPVPTDIKQISIEEIVEETNVKSKSSSTTRKKSSKSKKSSPSKRKPLSPIANIVNRENLNDVDNDYSISLQNFDVSSSEVHQVIIDKAFNKFIDCALNIGTDFILFQNNQDRTCGIFLCKLFSNNPKHVEKINVTFSDSGLPYFANIHNHLRTHFIMNTECRSRSSATEMLKRKSDDSNELGLEMASTT